MGAVVLLVLYRFWMRSLPRTFRGIILTLRGLLLLLVFLLLLDLQLAWTRNIQVPPRIGVFLDNSLSMANHPSASPSTVFSQVTTVVNWANKMNYEPVIMTFGEKIARRPNLRFTYLPDDRLTNFTLLSDVWLKGDLEAGFLFSDGVATSGRDPGAIEGAPDMPIHTVGIGDTSSGLDLSIAELRYPLSMLEQESGTIQVTVRGSHAAQKRSRLYIFQEDQLIHSEPFQIRSREFLQKFDAPVVGRLDAPGFRVELMVLSEEANIENNRREFQIDILPGQRQITLITGALSPNTAEIVKILGRTRHANVDRLTFLRGRWQGDEQKFWSTSQHLVVLDNYPTTELPEGHLDRLLSKMQRNRTPVLILEGPDNYNRDFVRLGRSLGMRIGVAAESRGVLQRLNPRVQPAFGGSRAAALGHLGSEFPPAPLVHRLESSANRSMAPLLVDEEQNLVIGFGEPRGTKVTVLLLPSLAATHLKLHRAGMGEYLGGILQWLVEWVLEPVGFSPYVVQPDRRQYHLGEKVILRGIMRDRAGVKVLQPLLTMDIQGPGDRSTVSLNYDFDFGEYSGEFWPGEPGAYHLMDYDPDGSGEMGARTTFFVQAGRVELESLRQNRYGLERLAQSTGGQYRELQEIEPLLANLVYAAQSVRQSDHYSIWQLKYLWVAMVLLLGLEWILRRVAGLI